jgi:hypothetical protein
VQACAELGTSLVAFSPVGRSILTDNPIRPEQIDDIPFLKVNPRFLPENLRANLAITEGFQGARRRDRANPRQRWPMPGC